MESPKSTLIQSCRCTAPSAHANALTQAREFVTRLDETARRVLAKASGHAMAILLARRRDRPPANWLGAQRYEAPSAENRA